MPPVVVDAGRRGKLVQEHQLAQRERPEREGQIADESQLADGTTGDVPTGPDEPGGVAAFPAEVRPVAGIARRQSGYRVALVDEAMHPRAQQRVCAAVPCEFRGADHW